ncbi:MAG: hypothetical protein ABFS32_17600 [Bacteroidota bacterium]
MGTGIVSYTYGTYGGVSSSTFGLAFKAGLEYTPSRFIGLGIDLQVNLNPKYKIPFPFLMLKLDLGILRPPSK